MTAHRHLIFAMILTFGAACGGGNPDDSDASTSDSSTNPDGTSSDAALDGAVSDASNDLDASVDEEDSSVVEDAGPVCPGDAGTGATSTAAATCMVICQDYIPLCGLPTTDDCQADCVAYQATATWTAARWGRMLDCVDIENANECAAAAACTALVSDCP